MYEKNADISQIKNSDFADKKFEFNLYVEIILYKVIWGMLSIFFYLLFTRIYDK